MATLENKTQVEEQGKVRMNLVMSPELAAALDDLAERNHTSKSEVLRRAVSLLMVVQEAKNRKERVGLFNTDRHLLTEIVGV